MSIVLLLLMAASAATLRVDSVLRSGCGDDEDKVATLSAGETVEVRSALSGASGTCYKVVGSAKGKKVMGYVPARNLEGLESFDQARRGAKDITFSTASKDVGNIVQNAAAKSGREHPATKAWALIEANQPAEALRMLEKDLQRYPTDPYLHAVAGIAFYRMDDLERAVFHWKESRDIEANPAIDALIRNAEREKKADKGSDRMLGNRVVLRYERGTITDTLALTMLQVLDQEYTRVSSELGCRATERVTAVAQSREAYFQSTQAAEWSGGLYDGRIHVPISDSRAVSPAIRKTFAHELTHACLHELGSWPIWFQEGMAQKYSGDSLAADAKAVLENMAKKNQLPKLSQLGQNWSRLNSQNAYLAYNLALYGVETLLRLKANTGILNMLNNPSAFSEVEAEVEKALGF